MTTSPYKRRRPSLIRNFWVYRRMIALAMVLGLMLWFIVINDTPVIVHFPFQLGELHTRSGIAMLLGSLVGMIAGALITAILFTVHRRRDRGVGEADPRGPGKRGDRGAADDDLPPPDYGAKTPDGFPDARWAAR